MTPITPEDELLRREYGGRAPQNFCDDATAELDYRAGVAGGDIEAIARANERLKGRMRFRNHTSASKVREALPQLWESAFTFAVDRHPYEKVVSMAWRQVSLEGNTEPDAVDAAIEQVIEKRRTANYPLYMDGTQLLVDRVFRYEEFWSHFSELAARWGRSLPSQLPSAKSGYRIDTRRASEILTKRQKRRIAKFAAPEFELLGYER